MNAVQVDIKDYICTVTIDRPPVNATDRATYECLAETFRALDKREDVKVAILTGAGKVFMAGNEMDEIDEMKKPVPLTEYHYVIQDAYMAVKNCRYPVIGAINGSAAGAGTAFAGCCDVLIAAAGAKFSLSEIKVGVIGADGFASLMVPEKVLRYMAFSGDPLPVEDIAQWGGIWKVVPRDEVLPEARKVAERFCKNARYALIYWKENLNRNYDHKLVDKFDVNLLWQLAYLPHEDCVEAYRAYVEKREPRFDEK